MTTPADKTPEILEAIATLQQSLNRSLEALEADDKSSESQREYVDAIRDYVDALKTQVDAQKLLVQSVADAQKASAGVFNVMAEGINSLNPRMDGLTAKVDGLTNDIAEVKGEHARSAMLRSAPLIADALVCQLIAEVPKGVLLGFAKITEANGEPHNDVESFKNADMVLHVMNSVNQPGYIAVEVSFTVDVRDVTRASRNAAYLQKYTGLPSYSVVAGVDVLRDAQDRIDQGEAHLYRIQRRELNCSLIRRLATAIDCQTYR